MDVLKNNTVGVICELNPLHNGHVYLLSEARRLAGEDGCVVCVMSGRSTQRGELAVAEPYARARMALSGGADLVLELPFPWSSGSAETFAEAGVRILASAGVAHLVFGSECGDITLLTNAAALVRSPDFVEAYAAACREGKGTAGAFAQTLQALAKASALDLPDGFPSSNDLLGIAYLSAISNLGSREMIPHTIKRKGQDYRDEILTDADYPSATALRRLIDEAACDPVSLSAMLEGTMPPDALDVLLNEIREKRAPVDMAPLCAFYHAHFRLAEGNLARDVTAEMGGGLREHLHKCARTAPTPEAFMTAIETKQYTRARLRRSLLFAVTGVTGADLASSPVYTRVLSANRQGRAFLSHAKKAREDKTVEIITKPAHAPACRQRVLDERLDAIYTLCLPEPKEAGWLMRLGAYMES